MTTAMMAEVEPRVEAKSAGVVGLLASTWMFPFAPVRMGRVWLKATVVEAGIIAGINVATGLIWAYLLALCIHLWEFRLSIHPVGKAWNFDLMQHEMARFPAFWMRSFELLGLLDKAAVFLVPMGLLAVGLALPFFVMLPFGARPGTNKACVKHVVRTVLLGVGAVHVWGAAFVGMYALMFLRAHDDRAVANILWLMTGLGLWTFVSLVRAVRLDYRAEKDLPGPRDPTCDVCGYNLVMSDPAGRCPECGRPVEESIGAHTRPPTAWESWPSVLNVKTIVCQLKMLVRRPRALFFSMPTLTGQRAAQRWMLLSMGLIGVLSALIVPGMMLVQQVFVDHMGGPLEFTPISRAGMAAMTLAWPLFGMMMVGIETAGIAGFSAMRGRQVYLATAAKVTCYSSVLMFLWVILGGLQLMALVYAYDVWSRMHVMSMRTLQMAQVGLAISLAVAHIGGLLWYELTVYRGIRGVQFANK